MASPANSTVQNLLPVQAYFNVDGSFNTFIGQGVAFYATANPVQSGLTITNSTINSTTIGALVPSTAVFSSGQVLATPVGNTDIANKLYVDSVASGLSWKAPFQVATTVNLASLSGLPIIDTYQTVAGSRVLVKNQTNGAENGIYIASSGAWAYAADGDTWSEYISAIGFIEFGTQQSSAWYCSAQSGGTLGVTNMIWSNFSVAGTYFAGTGLSLSAFTFSITNTGVTAATYGSASAVPVIAVNAQGQITSATTTTIAITNAQVSGLGTMSTQNANSVAITGGTIDGTAIGATTAAAVTGTTITAGTQFTGNGTGLTGTATSLNIGGTALKATNIVGGTTGSLPYQSAVDTTTFLAAGTNGQVLTLASGVPSWTAPAATGVTSVSGTGTVNGITLTGTVTSSGSLTLGGTLDLSSPPTIGNTTANTISGTTITATTQFTGAGTGLTGTASALSIGGNAATATTATTATSATTATTATNLAGGAANRIAVQTGAGATSFITAPTVSNSYLEWNGSAFAFSTVSAGLTVTDDTTTNATRYLTFTSATSGTISTINTASTKLTWNPGAGILSLAGATGALTVPTGTTAQRPATAVAGQIRYNTTLNSVEIYSGIDWIVITSQTYSVNYLVVGGGGGGGSAYYTGAGGAGSFLTAAVNLTPTTMYTITIGAGGAGATGLAGTAGTAGASSIFTSIATCAGGGGGKNTGAGIGGAAGIGSTASTGGEASSTGSTSGTGGGGSGINNAGANGVQGGSGAAGSGGAGTASALSGASVFYGGGGGGGSYLVDPGNNGGTGGGGRGAFGGGAVAAVSGTVNTGGGGGAASHTATPTGGSGGSGIVIISYAGSQRGTGGTITTSGGNTIHTFTSSSTYTA